LRVGVLALQGDVSEHIDALERAGADALPVRHSGELDSADGAVIPGGESTTISDLLFERGIDRDLRSLADRGGAVWGTCAGMVVMASRGGDEVEETDQELLGFIDAEVERNAFGRQRESFKASIQFDELESSFPGVFIRAPAYTDVGHDVRVLSKVNGAVVAARSGRAMATAFHPELVRDDRVHRYFISMVGE